MAKPNVENPPHGKPNRDTAEENPQSLARCSIPRGEHSAGGQGKSAEDENEPGNVRDPDRELKSHAKREHCNVERPGQNAESEESPRRAEPLQFWFAGL